MVLSEQPVYARFHMTEKFAQNATWSILNSLKSTNAFATQDVSKVENSSPLGNFQITIFLTF